VQDDPIFFPATTTTTTLLPLATNGARGRTCIYIKDLFCATPKRTQTLQLQERHAEVFSRLACQSSVVLENGTQPRHKENATLNCSHPFYRGYRESKKKATKTKDNPSQSLLPIYWVRLATAAETYIVVLYKSRVRPFNERRSIFSMATRCSFENSNEIGVFAALTNSYCLTGMHCTFGRND
jgi:hypothetical protein